MPLQVDLKANVEGIDIEVITGNTFSFTFKNANDRRQVLMGGPWSFYKLLLVLEEPIGKGEIHLMKFNKVPFWIKIHNVPLIYMTTVIGRFLGSMIGKVIEIDEGKSEGYDGSESTMLLRADNSIKMSQGRQQREDQQNIIVDKVGLGEVRVNPTLLRPVDGGAISMEGGSARKRKEDQVDLQNLGVDLEPEASIPYSSGMVADERELHVEQGKE
ncbi:hypothetical protein EZV62_014778 [Acer yangbiense]|uniref:Uncharacterized protein n=1 Tax=Acer yangbiense TaxID=1000413 RepID=A0A5C7HTP9_9ROSI|nr:hypothetical protein EZV62_014778 [Acer yangbiense]